MSDPPAFLRKLDHRARESESGGWLTVCPEHASTGFSVLITEDAGQGRYRFQCIEAGPNDVCAAEGRLLQLLELNHADIALAEKSGAWDDPIPLRSTLDVRKLPVFPLEALPAWVAEWAVAIAAEKGTSPDLPAALALGVIAGAIQRLVIVSPRPGYYESTSLYLIPALPPGQGKTPVFKSALLPLRMRERRRIVEWEAERAAWQAETELRDRERRELIAVGSKDDETPHELLAEQLAELAPIVPPPAPRLVTDDATPEALAALIGEHGRMVAASDEGAALFENLAGRYSANGSSSWDVFNKAHSGSPLIVDRRGSGSIVVDDAALSLVIATQTSVVLALHNKRGTAERGVLARLLYSLPAPVWPAEATPEAHAPTVSRYVVRIGRLWERTPGLMTDDETGLPQPMRLTFARPAADVFEQWELECRARVRSRVEDDDESAGVGWLAKLAGQTARVAACLHVAERWTSDDEVLRHDLALDVDADTVTRAIAIARYFAAHAATIFQIADEPVDVGRASRVLAWIGRRDEPLSPFSTRDAQRALARGSSTSAPFTAALERLADHGYLRALQPEQRSGRPGRPASSPRWEPHPSLVELLADPLHARFMFTPSDKSDSPTEPLA
jgi:hypothetical protein